MKCNYGLIVVIIVCLYASYARVQKYNASLASAEDEAVIDTFINGQHRENFAGTNSPSDRQQNPSAASGKSFQEETKLLADGSKINVMYDGFGNKTETRCFNNSPRLKCVTLNSAASGQREAVAYGPNGERNIVPENMLDRVMTGTGEEIASSAGIFSTQRQMPQQPPEVYSRTTPLPSPASKSADNQFPIQNKTAEQADEIKPPESMNNSETESSGGGIKNLLNEKRTATVRKLQ